MIDWLSAILPLPYKVPGGHVVRISPDGEIQSEAMQPYRVTGSFDDTVMVSNVHALKEHRGQPVSLNDLETYVYISGNPAKFLQGHNVYGTWDLQQLAAKFFRTVARSLGVSLDDSIQWAEIGWNGDYEVTRIDLTENYRVEGGYQAVSRWIYSAHKTARMSHKSASMSGGNTLYFGKNSRRHSVKIYNKYLELLKHPIDRKLRDATVDCERELMDDANGLLRVEVTYRARKLRDMGCDMGKMLSIDVLRNLHRESVKGLQISEQMPNYKVCRETVGRAAYCSYLAWLGGENLKEALNDATFYRHRKTLLVYGVDLLMPRDVQESSNNVIPLIHVLEAAPVAAPEWYYEKGLIAA